MSRLFSVTILLLFACGGDDDATTQADAASPLADASLADAEPPSGVTGAYARVIPGYETAAACRAENPDVLFTCRELLSVCEDGRSFILFTDIVFDGDWVRADDTLTITYETWDGAFSDDGTTVFEIEEDGALQSDEVYGDRAFAPSSDPIDDLCS